MKFFLDANIPSSSISIFKKFNHSVEHARNIGMANAIDSDILEHAVKNDQILVTKDVGFGNILDYPIKSHHGVIIIRLPFYYTAIQINNELLKFLKTLKKEEIKNSIVVVELNRYRIRR